LSTLVKRPGRGALTQVVQVVVLALVLYLTLTFVVQAVHVLGSSMNPTVRDQNYLLAARLPYRFHGPDRGDIVILRDPEDPSVDFIKRVIGLPGERILIHSAEVYINDHQLAEPYLQRSQPWVRQADWPISGEPLGLASDEYFVMGDNRNSSDDSRGFGPIRASAIQAHAWVRLLPLTQFGPVDAQRPYETGQTLAASG
jgi:signal peptidase I